MSYLRNIRIVQSRKDSTAWLVSQYTNCLIIDWLGQQIKEKISSNWNLRAKSVQFVTLLFVSESQKRCKGEWSQIVINTIRNHSSNCLSAWRQFPVYFVVVFLAVTQFFEYLWYFWQVTWKHKQTNGFFLLELILFFGLKSRIFSFSKKPFTDPIVAEMVLVFKQFCLILM